jgi:Putative beta-barrel porin-2, OmpL-like. bbp2
MVKLSSKGGVGKRFLTTLGLAAVVFGGAMRSQAQSTVEERLAAMEARIQQLESELAAARGAAPAVVPVNASASTVQGAFIRPAVLTTSADAEMALASAAAAQDGAAAAPPAPTTPDFTGDFTGLNFFKGVQFGGFLDAYYMYDFNAPGSMKIDPGQSRNFDLNHNSLTLSQVDLEAMKAVSETSPLGYMVQMVFGPTANLVNGGDAGIGNSTAMHFMQYYMTLRAPGKRGVTLDFGKFVTPMGEEVIDNRANWNYSRGLLFSLAIPYYHFGARATLPLNGKVTLTAFLVNGWNNVIDNNGGKTGGFSLALNPSSKFGVVLNYLGGPEQPGSTSKRNTFDAVLTAKLGSKMTFVENVDYGKDTNAADGSHVHWVGTASYLRLQPNAKFALTPRFEFYNDPEGFTSGTRQELKEFTLTPEFTVHSNLIIRVEYRHDWSNAPTFTVGSSTGDMFQSDQNTFGSGMILKF